MENPPLGGGGSATGDYPLKINVLRHWILPNNQLKKILFYSIFGWGWGDPFQLESWSEVWFKLKSSLEKPSDKYQRTHIIQNSFNGAYIIFHLYFSFTKRDVGQALGGKFHYFWPAPYYIYSMQHLLSIIKLYDKKNEMK